jgi:hypothetical protein
MTRKSIGRLTGLGLFAVVACGGGGYAHDYAEPDPDAPGDPAAPPADTTTPPFGDVAPPPPGSGSGVGGTTGTGGSGGNAGGGGKGGMPEDCTELCDLAEARCPGAAWPADSCTAECEDIASECFPDTRAFYACAIENDCEPQSPVCEQQVLDVIECVGSLM